MLKSSCMLTIAAVLSLTGCSKSPAPGTKPAAAPPGSGSLPATTPSGAEWKTFSPPEGRFSVQLPGTAQLFPSGDETVKNYGVELPGGYVYLVSESTRPGVIIDAAKGLPALRDAQVGSNKLLFDEEMSMPIGPGREFGFVDPDGDAWHVRAFVNNNTIYQLMTLAPGAAFSRDDPKAMKFLDSFTLLGPPQNNATGDK